MSRIYVYCSGLAEQINEFIEEKRALGCKYDKEAKTFYSMDRFLVKEGVKTPALSQEVVEKWISKRPNEKQKNQRWRLNFTKRFAENLLQKGYDAYYPSLSISSRNAEDFVPYIFSNSEISDLIGYFENMTPSRQYPKGHIVFPLLFKTLICCGLRAGEAANLMIKEVDIENGILYINNAKHGKFRQVPISEYLRMEFVAYRNEIHEESGPDDYFFPNARGKPHHTNVIYDRFRDALWACGIQHKGRGYGPRVHDLRHTFAVRCMLKFAETKGDITTALPYLSVYLGHYNINKTQYYLHLVSEAYPNLVQKECDYLGDTIPTWEVPNEEC